MVRREHSSNSNFVADTTAAVPYFVPGIQQPLDGKSTPEGRMEPKEVVFVLGGPGSGKGTHVSDDDESIASHSLGLIRFADNNSNFVADKPTV